MQFVDNFYHTSFTGGYRAFRERYFGATTGGQCPQNHQWFSSIVDKNELFGKISTLTWYIAKIKGILFESQMSSNWGYISTGGMPMTLRFCLLSLNRQREENNR
jgi:hypothetical protein